MHEFVAPREGAATFTMKWPNGTNDMDLWVTAADCTRFDASNCQVFAVAAGASEPEQVSMTLSAGQAVRLWVVNYGFSAQNYTIDIDIR